MCGELISDTERTLQKARYLESEADRKHLEAHTELERAEDTRRDAELYRDEIIEEAKRQAEEILDRGRATAERESSEMKQRASIESEKMLASARVMREAASEEMEAQKIYAEAARFKADSQGTLRQAQTRLVEGRTEAQIKSSARDIPEPPAPPASVVKTIRSGVGDASVDHQAKVNQAAALANALAQSVEPPKGNVGKTKDDSPSQALEELRDMHKAASKAVNAAMAKNKKTTKAKSAPKRKKPAAKKTSK